MDMNIFSSFDDEIEFYTGKSRKKTHRGNTAPRSVKYVAPGHTRVTYKNRVLDINFKQSQKEYDQLQKRRRNVANRQRSARERYETAQRHRDLKSDKYSLEDMRARMRDDHWEEVCGHKRWNYDSNSTVKEFKKYLAHQRRY